MPQPSPYYLRDARALILTVTVIALTMLILIGSAAEAGQSTGNGREPATIAASGWSGAVSPVSVPVAGSSWQGHAVSAGVSVAAGPSTPLLAEPAPTPTGPSDPPATR